MVKVKVKKTRKILKVTNNIAHGMIERGEAILYKENVSPKNKALYPKRKNNGSKNAKYRTK